MALRLSCRQSPCESHSWRTAFAHRLQPTRLTAAGRLVASRSWARVRAPVGNPAESRRRFAPGRRASAIQSRPSPVGQRSTVSRSMASPTPRPPAMRHPFAAHIIAELLHMIRSRSPDIDRVCCGCEHTAILVENAGTCTVPTSAEIIAHAACFHL